MPENVVGRFADLGVALVRGPDVAIAADGCVAYPTGVEFHMTVQSRRPEYEMDRFFGGPHPPGRRGEADPDVLRVGFSSPTVPKPVPGRSRCFARPTTVLPTGPCSASTVGEGGGRSWDVTLWLWPLPPDGPLALVVEWRSQGVPETRVGPESSARPIRTSTHGADCRR